MVKIKTTHVGSLPRSNELSSLLASKDNKEEISIKKFDEVVRNNVLEVVYTETDQNDYPDEDMSPYCGISTRGNSLQKCLWSYCECWNTGV